MLIARDGPGLAGLADLPQGARVGTGSLRRQAQILARRPDVEIVPMRGNVGTRLRKLADGAADATLLALAGLKRLGEEVDGMAVLEPAEMLPAVGQGALGIECRTGDERMQDLLQPIVDPATTAASSASGRCWRCSTAPAACRSRASPWRMTRATSASMPDRAARRQRLPPSRARRGHDGGDRHRPRRRRRAACGRRPRLVRVMNGPRLL